MIEEVKILTKTGMSIFSGKVDLDDKKIYTSTEGHVLFAGFISAIISISEETQESDIRELGYKEHKIIFAPSENLIFLAFANQKVPNKDVDRLLDKIMAKFFETYEDSEYPFIDEEMAKNLLSIVNEAFLDSFWWLAPTFSVSSNKRLLRNSYTDPASTYYIAYLPNSFLLTALFGFVITLLSTIIFGTEFTGFSTNAVANPSIMDSIFPLLLIWLGTPVMMKLINWKTFRLNKFLILSGIFLPLLIFMVIFSGNLYVSLLKLVITGLPGFLVKVIEMIFYLAPLNISFFMFIVITAYAGSFVTEMRNFKYYTTYLLSVVTMISIGGIV
ncbi:MAG: hypothetical protein INQ03_01065 [Candidatus Heimdallarchaeota archaeon]|nr:hypothetical protein [Candidatus Heimdallarchaeota archaeon]